CVPASRAVVIASYLLIAGALLLVLWRDLLPGLLFVCIGFLATRRLARWGQSALHRLRPGKPPATWPRALAATLVILAPLGLLGAAFAEAREFVLHAPEQYKELLDYIARTILELRLKLPADMAVYLP